MKSFSILLFIAAISAVLTGCYTQFGPTRAERAQYSGNTYAQDESYADTSAGDYASDDEYDQYRNQFYGEYDVNTPPYVYDPYYYQPWYRPWLPIGFYGASYWDYWNSPGSGYGYGHHHNNDWGVYHPSATNHSGVSWTRRPTGNTRNPGQTPVLYGGPRGGGPTNSPAGGGSVTLPGASRNGGSVRSAPEQKPSVGRRAPGVNPAGVSSQTPSTTRASR